MLARVCCASCLPYGSPSCWALQFLPTYKVAKASYLLIDTRMLGYHLDPLLGEQHPEFLSCHNYELLLHGRSLLVLCNTRVGLLRVGSVPITYITRSVMNCRVQTQQEATLQTMTYTPSLSR